MRIESKSRLLCLALGLLAAWVAITPIIGQNPTPAAAPPWAAQPEKSDESSSPMRLVHEGIAIDCELENLDPRKTGTGRFEEGDPVRVRFRITDTTTKTPMSGVFPGAWMDLKPTDAGEAQRDCKTKVEAFVGGGLLYQAELDLNVYYVLALNEDATITVVDPLFGFGSTKLLAMIDLPGPGEDWALSTDQRTLFVSVPATKQISVADMSTWKLLRNIDLKQAPTRLALQPDGHYLWAALRSAGEASGGVAVIRADTREIAATIPTGRGEHDIVFTSDSARAFVTNSEDGTVTAIDVAALKPLRTIAVGGNPRWADYSEMAGALYVSGRDGTISAIDGHSMDLVASIKTDPGLERIRFAPDDRHAFIVNPEQDTVVIVDAAVRDIVQTGDMMDGPDQVAFSDELAYVRHRDSEIILMIPLSEIGRVGESVPAVDFPGGNQPFGKSLPSLADAMIQAPGATAVLVANPADRMIYYYKEGMAAPMGSFKNYGRQPRAVLVVDRSLREKAPGEYETTVQMRRPGKYDLALFLDSPRLMHCFEVEVGRNLELERQRDEAKPVEIIPLPLTDEVRIGHEIGVRFRLLDPVNKTPKTDIPDLQALVFLAPGISQDRLRMIDRGQGIYEVRFRPSEEGIYYIFLASPSLGLAFNESPQAIVDSRPRTGGESSNQSR